tara:strand:+ start:188 stop:364 length:177 start_codon:yes stop_codon:yes gene_type:complete
MKNYTTLSKSQLESELCTLNMTLSEIRGNEIEMAPVWKSRIVEIKKVLLNRFDATLYN